MKIVRLREVTPKVYAAIATARSGGIDLEFYGNFIYRQKLYQLPYPRVLIDRAIQSLFQRGKVSFVHTPNGPGLKVK